MGDPVADANAPLPNPQPPRLPKWEWLVPIGISVFLVIYGVQVIATKEASAGRGFRGGPARLTTTQAWFMGGAFFFGAGILPFGYLAARRKQLAEKAAKDEKVVAELAAQGMDFEEADAQIAADRSEERRDIRKQGILFIAIGCGLMLVGFVGGIALFLLTHKVWPAMVGLIAVIIGKYYFFWPGVRYLSLGRRNYNDVD